MKTNAVDQHFVSLHFVPEFGEEKATNLSLTLYCPWRCFRLTLIKLTLLGIVVTINLNKSITGIKKVLPHQEIQKTKR
jgi:hypothetical protein